MTGFVITGLMIGVYASILYVARQSEKRIWNNGISRKTGNKWVCFDVDSSGSRIYKSTGNTPPDYCWIGFEVDK